MARLRMTVEGLKEQLEKYEVVYTDETPLIELVEAFINAKKLWALSQIEAGQFEAVADGFGQDNREAEEFVEANAECITVDHITIGERGEIYVNTEFLIKEFTKGWTFKPDAGDVSIVFWED